MINQESLAAPNPCTHPHVLDLCAILPENRRELLLAVYQAPVQHVKEVVNGLHAAQVYGYLIGTYMHVCII